MPTWEGANHCKLQRHSAVICAKTAEPIEVLFGLWARIIAWAESIMCYMGGPDPPWVGAILVDRGTHCKVWALSAVSCAKRLNLSICRFDCGLEWAEGCTSSIVFTRWRQCALMEGHVCASCRITLNHPSTTAMRLMANYFDHLLSLDTPLTQSHRQPSVSS